MNYQLQYFCLALAAMAASANAFRFTDVSIVNPKTPGFAAPNIQSPELDLRLHATDSIKLDSAVATTQYYGDINKVLLLLWLRY